MVLLIEVSETPALSTVLAVPGSTYRHIVPGPRSRGIWQQRALWETGRRMLAQCAGIRYAVFLDADCTPTVPDFFSRVEALHDSGVKASQPWRKCQDAKYDDIGGTSHCWQSVFGPKTIAPRCAEPGFCWSFDLAWLEFCGGIPHMEPLGGGDALLMHEVFIEGKSWVPEASHMRQEALESRFVRQPAAALDDVDLNHHSHGPRGNRQYGLRYRVPADLGLNMIALHEEDGNGLTRVKETPLGDAWLRMIERRSEWSEDRNANLRLWREVYGR